MKPQNTQTYGTQVKAVLREKLIALSASKTKTKTNQNKTTTTKQKLERAYTNSLTAHLKALEQKEKNSPKRRRWQEIIKLRTEINQMETKKLYKESTKPGAGSLRKSTS
jgi:acyl-homoserine lactone acylase PvdQ